MLSPPPYDWDTKNRDRMPILGEAQGWRCAYCGIPMVWPRPMAGWPDAPPESDHASIDHVLAKAMGGMPTWGNEIAACRACNEGRGHLDARNFFDQVQRLGRDKAIAWAVDKRRRAMIKIRDQRAFERRDANRRKDIERLQSLSTPSALSAPSADE